MVLAAEDSPAYMLGGFDLMAAMMANQPKVEQAFRTGGGVAWGEQAGCMFCAVARFFRPGYHNSLVGSWLPAFDDVVDKLTRGATVADVGCGHGWSTVMMAKAFPNSQFVGYDFHPGSIEVARAHADSHGVWQNVRLEAGTAKDYAATGLDLVTCFDCLHDIGDPAGAAAHVRRSLRPDGSWMIVEPMAGDSLEQNLNPVSRLFYAASTMICVPTSLSQEVGAAPGAQAGEARLREVITAGGFATVRRATLTPFNMILEARPWPDVGMLSRRSTPSIAAGIPLLLSSPRKRGPSCRLGPRLRDGNNRRRSSASHVKLFKLSNAALAVLDRSC
jgi:2-polyprenyl-3-methyl-5-hydroxy-6-metoxy-1,4-benzoquinol methylase